MKKLIAIVLVFSFLQGHSQDTLRRGVIFNGQTYRIWYVVKDPVSHTDLTPGSHDADITVWRQNSQKKWYVISNMKGKWSQKLGKEDNPHEWVLQANKEYAAKKLKK